MHYFDLRVCKGLLKPYVTQFQVHFHLLVWLDAQGGISGVERREVKVYVNISISKPCQWHLHGLQWLYPLLSL